MDDVRIPFIPVAAGVRERVLPGDGRMKSLHVLMLLDSAFPPPRGGGAEAQVRLLSRALRRRGHRVTVLTPLTPKGVQRRVGRVDGIPVCRLPYPRIRLLGGPWLWVRMALFLAARRRRYDVWHVHLANRIAAIAALVGRWLGRPVIIKVAGANEIERGPLAANASPLARLAYRCLLRAEAWQAISSRIATVLAKKGVPPERIAPIPNAVDTKRFRDIHPHGEGDVRFLFIGRLVPEKNLDTLLFAFAALSCEQPGVELRIVGAGPLERALQKQASDLGISSRVEFTGHRDDIEALVAQADYGVLPSRIEGLSNTLLECMASGLPMIASRVSGNEDLVRTGQNGWLFEPFDRAGLAACLAEAARLPVEERLALGRKAREAVERHSSLDSVVERLLELYRRPQISARAAAARQA